VSKKALVILMAIILAALGIGVAFKSTSSREKKQEPFITAVDGQSQNVLPKATMVGTNLHFEGLQATVKFEK